METTEQTETTPPKRKPGRPRKAKVAPPPPLEEDDDDDGDEEIYTSPSYRTDYEAPSSTLSRVQRQMEEEQHELIRDWMQGLGEAVGSYEIKLFRVEPKTYQGYKTDGFLKTLSGETTEEQIEDEYGGGYYRLQAMTQNPRNGKPKFFGTKMLSIHGPPKIEFYERQKANGHGGEDPTVASEALNMVKEFALRQQQQPRGGDELSKVMLQVLALMQEQNSASRKETEAIFHQLIDATKQKDDPVTTKLFTEVLNKDAGRLDMITASHQSELRFLRESHAQDIKRLEDKFDRDLSFVRQTHQSALDDVKRSRDNEVGQLQTSHANETKHLERGHKQEVEALKRDLARYEAQIAEMKVELAALRERKDQTLVDKAGEVLGFMGQMKELGFGGGDEEPKGRIDRIIDAVTENPGAIKQLLPWLNPPEAETPKQLAPQLHPAGDPIQAEDGKIYTPLQDDSGNVFMRGPDGALVQLSPEDAQQLRQHQTTQRAEAAAQTSATRGPTDEEIVLGAQYLEGAMQGGTPAENFALSAKALIPTPIIRYLEQHGADGFVQRAVQLNPESTLKSQKGRNYVRQVVDALLG